MFLFFEISEVLILNDLNHIFRGAYSVPRINAEAIFCEIFSYNGHK